MLRREFHRGWISAGMTAVLVCVMGVPARSAKAQDASGLEAGVHKALDNKKFRDVSVSVHEGTVMLTGTVERYVDKEDADRRAHRVHGVKGVDNKIEAGGSASISDEALRDKLAKGLAYDRVGYGTAAFNSINIGVRDGVVSLSGTVYGPTDKSSALGLVENTAGVRDVIDNLEVAPLSPMDDELRLRLARAIYGDSTLQKYALDPAKPIRITVVNGNVMLTGVVDNKMDRDVAGLRANGVSGAFKVVNELQVAGAGPAKAK